MDDQSIVLRLSSIIKNAETGVTKSIKYEFYRNQIKAFIEELLAGKQTDILVIMQRQDENATERLAHTYYKAKPPKV